LANRPAKFLKFLLESLYLNLKFQIAGVCWKQHTDPPHAPVLLRSHCERQHGRRAG
jgi:hypothetical protein